MFENDTYNNILERALRNVPSTVDKREGSIIFDTLSPIALELANIYMSMDAILDSAFAETATRQYLILIAKERGLSPEEATPARLKAEFNFRVYNEEYDGEYVQIGDRFNLDSLNYKVIEQLTNDTGSTITVTDSDGNSIKVAKGEVIPGVWEVECETAGTEGNKHLGTLLPITTIEGLTKAEATEVLILGEDAEDTETFRQRYFDSINNDAFGGNRADYIKWVKEMDGVGQVKVKRGSKGGAVTVIITATDGGAASKTLINTVKEALDPSATAGQGDGIVPIGHNVTVKTVSLKTVDVDFSNIELEADADKTSISSQITETLQAYASEINDKWESSSELKIYAAQALARCLDIEGVVNIEYVEFNGGDSYIKLSEEQIVTFKASLDWA
jgi:uncharacterized phage protein gp47/JayE